MQGEGLAVFSYFPSYSLPPLWTNVFEGRCQVYAETGLRGNGKDCWAKQWAQCCPRARAGLQALLSVWSYSPPPLGTLSLGLSYPRLTVVVPKLNLSLPIWVGVGAHSWQAHSLEATEE